MICPKCEATMHPIQHDGIEIDRCSGCQGLWFDAFEHEALKALQGSESIDSAATAAPTTSKAIASCPRCRVAMIGMVVAGQPHIAFESCGVCHGVYFDAGEFRDFREETFGEKLRNTFGLARKA
jgi:Zn-finger nucleic acid-binding protein